MFEDLSHLLPLILAAPIVWALWNAGQPQALFTVRLWDGKTQVEGTVTPAFLERIREVAASNGFASGIVRGYAKGSLIRLWFSSEIPEAGRQQLRNWWASFGWPPPGAGPNRAARRYR